MPTNLTFSIGSSGGIGISCPKLYWHLTLAELNACLRFLTCFLILLKSLLKLHKMLQLTIDLRSRANPQVTVWLTLNDPLEIPSVFWLNIFTMSITRVIFKQPHLQAQGFVSVLYIKTPKEFHFCFMIYFITCITSAVKPSKNTDLLEFNISGLDGNCRYPYVDQ